MLFNRINIHHFRGIESLAMENIKRINVLTGRNHCGKTSVLEAIFLLVGMSNPQLAVGIHNFRGLKLTDAKDFSYLFHGFDFSRHPSLTGGLESEKRTLEIKPIHPIFTGQQEPAENRPISSTWMTTEDALDGLAFDFTVDENAFHAEVKITQVHPTTLPGADIGRINVTSVSDYKENLHASFINPGTIMNGLYQRLEAVLVRKESEGIIHALREIEPNLRDVRLGTGGKIYADITHMGRLVPINIMGDGIIKILAILVAILEMKEGILLIDEIENGLHYSALMPLWKAIFKMALESNVQLFVATHSDECIDAMVRTYRDYHESGIGEDSIRLFRIDRNKEGQHRAFGYDSDLLLAGIEEDFEVR
uniref:ATPase/GTPase, AAA15 family n=1 Tax=Candidatus Kentrum sp. FM TaxID=2126340 RepID=A0A450TQF6_9GAMM|nr:MAG: ATPase/GTPase, AAA15 family [Candidatus Kentron sp. FM]VFJ70314.1 MAG: ATPase/GTPase, AAA15 family [Candidatus Kentron sp. FM]VFK18440.1 MAG: ATPase/GTPase, AAA15 family [Candidatus Kentron sp. FM]